MANSNKATRLSLQDSFIRRLYVLVEEGGLSGSLLSILTYKPICIGHHRRAELRWAEPRCVSSSRRKVLDGYRYGPCYFSLPETERGRCESDYGSFSWFYLLRITNAVNNRDRTPARI